MSVDHIDPTVEELDVHDPKTGQRIGKLRITRYKGRTFPANLGQRISIDAATGHAFSIASLTGEAT